MILSCKQLYDFLADWCEQRLSPEERARFEAHLALCPACIDYLDSYEKTIAIGRAALTGRAAEDLASIPESLVQAILAARSGKR